MRILIALIVLLMGCGNPIEFIDGYNYSTTKNPYIIIATTQVSISTATKLQLINSITYTSPITSQFIIDATTLLSPLESEDGNTIDLGSLTIQQLKVNNLKVCGVNGTEKCTSAIIRTYTNDLGGPYTGLGGFVNITDIYAETPIMITSTQAIDVIGHTVANANIVSEYTIPVKDRKLTLQDFIDANQLVSFPIVVDFANGGAGEYEANITLEVAVQ